MSDVARVVHSPSSSESEGLTCRPLLAAGSNNLRPERAGGQQCSGVSSSSRGMGLSESESTKASSNTSVVSEMVSVTTLLWGWLR